MVAYSSKKPSTSQIKLVGTRKYNFQAQAKEVEELDYSDIVQETKAKERPHLERDPYMASILDSVNVREKLDEALNSLPLNLEITDEFKELIIEAIYSYKVTEIVSYLGINNGITVKNLPGLIASISKKLELDYNDLKEGIPNIDDIIGSFIDPTLENGLNIKFSDLSDQFKEDLFRVFIRLGDSKSADKILKCIQSGEIPDLSTIMECFNIICNEMDLSYKYLKENIPNFDSILSQILDPALKDTLGISFANFKEDFKEDLFKSILELANARSVQRLINKIVDGKTPSLSQILDLLRQLNSKMDISYARLAENIPGLSNIVKRYAEPHIKDILNINYDKIGDLWDCIINDSSVSEYRRALNRACPTFGEDVSKFINKLTGGLIVIDPEEVNFANVAALFFKDYDTNVDKLTNIIDEFTNMNNFSDLTKAVSDATDLMKILEIDAFDVAHTIWDTGGNLIDGEVRSLVGGIPFIGEGILDVSDWVSNGYNDLADAAKDVPIIGYLMNNDPIDMAEDIYNVGCEVYEDVSNTVEDLWDRACNFFGW